MQSPKPSTKPGNQRCPKCNAVLHNFNRRCYECDLLAKLAPSASPVADSPNRSWRNSVDFLNGFGIPLDQLVALVICGVWLLLALVFGGVTAFLYHSAALLIPMVMIWFSEDVATFTGTVGVSTVSNESPPFLIKFLGWAFLLGIIGYTVYSIVTASAT